MHRAEKSSSKICRNREVERAQELHRKKIDGVKSYLTAITKPTAERSPTVFRRKLPMSSGVVSSSSIAIHKNPVSDSHQSIESPTSSLSMDTDNYSDTYCDEFETASLTLDKMDEFRVVTSTVDPRHPVHARVPPRASTHNKTLNGSFRTRRLKQIQVDNVGLFQRIRNSAAHYRKDELRRDWEQNVSYLTSICEFPLTKECIASQNNLQYPPQFANDDTDDFTGWRPTIKTPVHLPVMVHPIKAIPTSPKRMQLNLSPAFRSLRKTMPQQPSLPPITSPNRITSSMANLDGVLPPTASSLKIPLHNTNDAHIITTSTTRSIGNNGSRMSRRTLFSSFDGDAFSSPTDDDSSVTKSGLEITKYQLLKTGRFVGGTYLILTVFCGHGITNPYGFDVHALHPESQCEYQLNITKEMTHQLLDTISSSSLAAVTAAAAGTNLSMEQIAQNICDHVNFSTLESGLGELLFLVSTLGGSKDRVLLIDSDASSISFCLHHLVEIEQVESNPVDINDNSPGKRRKMQVKITTRPPKCCTASMTLIPPASGHSGGPVICFHLCDELSGNSTSSSQHCFFDAQVDVELEELYRVVGQAFKPSQFGIPGDRTKVTMSLERMVSTAIRYLHIVAVPKGMDAPYDHREVLIFNQHVNERLHLTGKPSIPRVLSQPMLRKSHITQSCGPIASPSKRESTGSLLLDSGLVWKNMYFLTRVYVDSPNSSRWRTKISIHKVDGSLSLCVFNSQSGQHSSRALPSEQVQAFASKLSTDTNGTHWTLLDFAKHILERMHVDVDLFGHEIITFPGLEVLKAARSGSCGASPRSRYQRERSCDSINGQVTLAGTSHSNHCHGDDGQVAVDMRALNQESFSEDSAGEEDGDGACEPEEDEEEAVDGVGCHLPLSSALVSRQRRQGQKRSARFGLRLQNAWFTIGPLGQLHV